MTPNIAGVETFEDHMDVVMVSFEAAWRKKYMKGQAEHGGRLWRKNTTPFLIDEVLDFVSYVAVLAPQLERAVVLLKNSLIVETDPEASRSCVQRALNILTIGNEEGIQETEL